MKKFDNTQLLEKKIFELLSKENDVSVACKKLSEIYCGLSQELPLLTPFQVKLVKSKSLQYSIFYQTPPKMSQYSIAILNHKYDAYLWTDCDGWCFDDLLYDLKDISKELSSPHVFEMIPQNVRELKSLIDEGYWLFLPDNLPTFDGNPPVDLREVLSWDPVNVLVGTSVQNMEIVTRKEWDNICKRETILLRENDA